MYGTPVVDVFESAPRGVGLIAFFLGHELQYIRIYISCTLHVYFSYINKEN
jgi:uncharacterized membrane protein YhhN